MLLMEFSVPSTNIHQTVAAKFAFSLVFSLALEKFVCVSLIGEYNYTFLSYSIVCFIVNCSTKDPIVMQIQLVVRSALTTIKRI